MKIPTDIEHNFSDFIDLDFYFTEDDLDDLENIVQMALDDKMSEIIEKAKEIVEDFKEELRGDKELREEFGIED